MTEEHRCAIPEDPRGQWVCPTCYSHYWADGHRWWDSHAKATVEAERWIRDNPL